MLQILDFGESDRYCHLRSDNYIIIPRKCRSEEKEGLLLASAHHRPSKKKTLKLWSRPAYSTFLILRKADKSQNGQSKIFVARMFETSQIANSGSPDCDCIRVEKAHFNNN